MTFRQTETPTVAAAKAGFSAATAYRMNTIRGCRHKRKRRVAADVAIRWLRFGIAR